MKKLILLIPSILFFLLMSCGVHQPDKLNTNEDINSSDFVHSHPVTEKNRASQGETESAPFNKTPSSPPLPVEQAIASIKVQSGFVLENVVSEPNIFTPVALAFDGNGRIWVAEMNTYMPDVKGNNEEVPEGNITLLEDSNGDGNIDKRTVFIDDVILPRTISLVKGGILYADHTQLFFAEVLEGDKIGVREVIDPTFAQGGSLEHKPNGMMYGLDNWYYNTKSNKRYKAVALDADIPSNSKEIYRNKYWKMVRGKTERRGQWGLSMDDYGRLYHNGNSSPASGEFLRPGSLLKNPNFSPTMKASKIGGNRVYAERMNKGINRGYLERMLIKDGPNKHKLRTFTAASGNVVYRGDNFPEKFYGISITPEPAANLISARKIIENKSTLAGKEIYPRAEILASTDERFRPVNLYTAPDGTLYIVDMYHGIIQHRVYITDYLEKHVLSHELDKHNNTMGRIYRLRWKEKEAGIQPQLQHLAPTQLVQYLAHENGWWRDTARRLIVESADKTVTTYIVSLIKQTQDHRAKINALWTLEGLDSVTLEAVKIALNSDNPKVKVSAIAVSEKLEQSAHNEMAALLIKHSQLSYEVALQVALSAGAIKDPQSMVALEKVLDKFGSQAYIFDAAISGLTGREDEFKKHLKFRHMTFQDKLATLALKKVSASGRQRLSASDKKRFDAGKKLYHSGAGCFGCHGSSGEGQGSMVPPLTNSEWVVGDEQRLAKIMLHGLAGEITVNNKKYVSPMVMPGLGQNTTFTDEDLASIATYIRNDWGNKAKVISSNIFKNVREKTKNRSMLYSEKELLKKK
jgi:putative membrane-bound dehydrogenase-like protein